MNQILLYGANGYTGRIIIELAQARGTPLVLAGRSEDAIAALAQQTGWEHRVFSLDDPEAVAAGIDGMTAVLHCAGPFAHTARPMAEACIASGVHYLDITGEIAVFERMARMGERAEAAGVMLLPGVGFDVVPSDCLARYLSDSCPDATELSLAFTGDGGVSHGTATTAVENIGEGGAIRRDGKITPVPAAYRSEHIDFGRGPVPAVTIPWGDVSTAWHSTGIPNIEVLIALPASVQRMMRLSRVFGGLLATGPMQWLLKSRIPAGGPSPEARESGWAVVQGTARAADGTEFSARLRCPEAYQLTAEAALLIATKVRDGAFKPGYQTPSSVFGPDLILEIDGVSREDLNPA